MEKFQSERRIVWQTTIPYTTEQNGEAERTNRLILENAKSMMSFLKLDKSFWAEAGSTTFYSFDQGEVHHLLGMTINRDKE